MMLLGRDYLATVESLQNLLIGFSFRANQDILHSQPLHQEKKAALKKPSKQDNTVVADLGKCSLWKLQPTANMLVNP